MGQRKSEYKRVARDKYQTPIWVTNTLAPHIPAIVRSIWEPASGDGFMERALSDLRYEVIGTDIAGGSDFLAREVDVPLRVDAIITNPPYDKGVEFVERALSYMQWISSCSFVAMLLRLDFDSAKTRRHLFADNPYWSKKIILMDRIRWEGIEQKKAGPSENHAWFLWRKSNAGEPPVMAYAQREEAKKIAPEDREAA